MVTCKDFKLKKINIPFDAVFHAMLDESYYLNSNYIKAVYEVDGMQSYNHVVETDDVYARVRFDRILFVVRKDRKVVIAMHTASISYKEMGIELYLSSQGSTGDEKRKLCWHNHKPYADVLPSDSGEYRQALDTRTMKKIAILLAAMLVIVTICVVALLYL